MTSGILGTSRDFSGVLGSPRESSGILGSPFGNPRESSGISMRAPVSAVVVAFIDMVYENTDQSWYSTDEENAHAFFSGPTFPQWAIDKLGYPEEGIAHGGVAAGFNMPAENRV